MTITSKEEIIYFFQGKKEGDWSLGKMNFFRLAPEKSPCPLGQSLNVEGNKSMRIVKMTLIIILRLFLPFSFLFSREFTVDFPEAASCVILHEIKCRSRHETPAVFLSSQTLNGFIKTSTKPTLLTGFFFLRLLFFIKCVIYASMRWFILVILELIKINIWNTSQF